MKLPEFCLALGVQAAQPLLADGIGFRRTEVFLRAAVFLLAHAANELHFCGAYCLGAPALLPQGAFLCSLMGAVIVMAGACFAVLVADHAVEILGTVRAAGHRSAGVAPGPDDLVLLSAPAHPVNEVVEGPAPAVRVTHDELSRVQLHHVELEPMTTRSELHRQAGRVGDEPEVLGQVKHHLAGLQLAGASHIGPRFPSFQSRVDDLARRISRVRVHERFGPRDREVAVHPDVAHELAGDALVVRARIPVPCALSARTPWPLWLSPLTPMLPPNPVTPTLLSLWPLTPMKFVLKPWTP